MRSRQARSTGPGLLGELFGAALKCFHAPPEPLSVSFSQGHTASCSWTASVIFDLLQYWAQQWATYIALGSYKTLIYS